MDILSIHSSLTQEIQIKFISITNLNSFSLVDMTSVNTILKSEREREREREREKERETEKEIQRMREGRASILFC